MCNSTPTIHSPISYESFLGKVNLKCFIRSIILTIIQNILFCIECNILVLIVSQIDPLYFIVNDFSINLKKKFVTAFLLYDQVDLRCMNIQMWQYNMVQQLFILFTKVQPYIFFCLKIRSINLPPLLFRTHSFLTNKVSHTHIYVNVGIKGRSPYTYTHLSKLFLLFLLYFLDISQCEFAYTGRK